MTRARLDRWVRTLRDQVALLEVPEEIDATFGKYRDNPVAFCRDVLGVESATRRSDGWSYQFAILADLTSEPRVAVPWHREDRDRRVGVNLVASVASV